MTKRAGKAQDSQQDAEELTPEQIERQIQMMRLAAARAEQAAAELNLERAQRAPAQMEASDELREIQLQTARLTMLREKELNDKFLEERETLIKKRADALKTIAAEERNRAAAHAACKHRVGGFKGDTYKGGKNAETSIMATTLPMIGHVLYLCYRCFDEAATPDRNLLHGTDEEKALYAKQLEKFNRFAEMFENSYNAQIMGGPQFQFEKDGLPVHPRIV